MELIKETVSVGQTVYSQQAQTYADGDIIVPDVKPDILKIIQVDASATVKEKSVTDGCVLVRGCVDMKILYIPDSREESIKSINTSLDFAYKAEKKSIAAGMSANVFADVDKVDFRLINSRKLSVKVFVGMDINVSGVRNLEFAAGIDGDICAEVKKVPVRVNSAVADCEREFVVRENMEIPSGKASICEILKVDSKICDKEIKALTGKAVIKGTANISVLYTGDNSSIEFMEADIPFTEVVDIPDLIENADCDMDCSICDMFYKTAEDNDGDMRIVNVEFAINTHISAYKTVETEIIEDCYVPGFDMIIDREEERLDEVICCPSVQNTLREIVTIDNGAPQINGVYHIITKASVTDTQTENSRVCVNGRVDAYILYVTDSEESPIYSCKREIPFTTMIESSGSEKGMDCEIKAEVEHVSYNLNMANEVELRIILRVNAKVIRSRRLELVSAVSEPVEKEGQSGIIIYFVQSGDSIWDISKRYGVSIDSVMQFNGISADEKVLIGRRLIIPTGVR